MPKETLKRREDRLLTAMAKLYGTRRIHGARRLGHCLSSCPRSALHSHPGWSAPMVKQTSSATSRERLGSMGGRPRRLRRASPPQRDCSGVTTTPYETGSHRPSRYGSTARSAQAVQVRWSVMATSGPGTSSGTALRQSGCSTSSTPDPETRWTTWRTPASTSYRSGRTPIACGGCAIPSHRTAVGGSRSSPRRMGSAQRTDLSIE